MDALRDLGSPLTPQQRESVAKCEQLLGYEFSNKWFLAEAITHASIANTRLTSYERLEFLGDSILGFIVCEYLFAKFPDWLEGDLTKIKSNVVSRETCAIISDNLRLADCLIIGKGVGQQGQIPRSVLANAFESIVGAIYLDGGFDSVRQFLLPFVERQVEKAVEGNLQTNYKSDLQQYSQKRFGLPPNYILLDQKGPDHDKWFKISAKIDKKEFEPAWGKNKKQAEQRAAANALATIEGNDLPFTKEFGDQG